MPRLISPTPKGEAGKGCETCGLLKGHADPATQAILARRTEKQAGPEGGDASEFSAEDQVEFWQLHSFKEAPGLVKIGRSSWTLLHSIAAYYPQSAPEHKKNSMRSFLYNLSTLFPCGDCGSDLRQYLDSHPPRVEGQKELAQWMCDVHNHVNKRLGKPVFPCDRVDERWKKQL